MMELKRKLAAVLAADVVGYSKLMAVDEDDTLQRLDVCRGIFQEHVVPYRGRIFNTAGDALLVELPSAVEALRCAIDIQKHLAEWNEAFPIERKMQFRIGIAIGDVVEQGNDLLGDRVNVAARLQGLATPGGICISRWVYEQVSGALDVGFIDLGEKVVKNIPKPVHVFAVDARGARDLDRYRKGAGAWTARKGIMSVAAAAIAVVLGAAAYIGLGNSGKVPADRHDVVALAPASPAPAASSTTATGSVEPAASPNNAAPAATGSFTAINPAGQPLDISAHRPSATPHNTPSPDRPKPSGAPVLAGPHHSGVKSDAAPAGDAKQPEAQQFAELDAGRPPQSAPGIPSQPQQAAPQPWPAPSAAIAAPTTVATTAVALPRKAGETFSDCDVCPQVVVVPAGEFVMGSPRNEVGREDDEGPQRRIKVPQMLAVGRTAVTVSQYEAFLHEAGNRTVGFCRVYHQNLWAVQAELSFANPGFPQRADHPAVCVSWHDAKAYVTWLSSKTGHTYRLPSEAEREYFTRAGTTTPFWWGETIGPQQANYDATLTYKGGRKGDFRRATRPALDLEPNSWGLSQVHGNAAEWVEDCWNRSYIGAPTDSSPWLSGDCSKRVLRGGAWGYDPKDLRSAYREAVTAEQRHYHTGFRVVRVLGADGR